MREKIIVFWSSSEAGSLTMQHSVKQSNELLWWFDFFVLFLVIPGELLSQGLSKCKDIKVILNLYNAGWSSALSCPLADTSS